MRLLSKRHLLVVTLALLIALAAGPLKLLGDYFQFIVASACFFFIAVLAVNLLAGLCGIWSLGHTAYVAIGAYSAAHLVKIGVPLELIVPLAAMAAGVIGFVLGLSAGRFSVLYFGLLTMALALVATEVISHWVAATGGDDGMKVSRPVSLLAGGPIDSGNRVVICVALAALAYLIGDAVISGRWGKRWLAVKGQRTAAMAIGLKPPLENALAFALSAAIASLSGVAMAFALGFIDPIPFSLDASVTLIVGTVVGGIGSAAGALVGAAFITAVPELARDALAISTFVYGGAMVLVLLFLRQGIAPAIAGTIRRRQSADSAKASPKRRSVDAQAMADLVSRLLPKASETLSLNHVSLQFSGLKALDDVSFKLAPGQAVGLIGPNGAGKTSLLNVLSGFYRPTADTRVRLGSTNVLATAASGRTGLGIGRTFQHAELYPELTLRDMLLVTARMARGRRRQLALTVQEPQEVAELILQGLSLQDYADHLPAELPFGIQKVADLGRVLATGACIVLLDEPFSGLDETERAELRAILQGMRWAGVSILIIDHAVQEVLDLADQVVVLDFGRLLAAGPPEDIRTNPAVIAAYFGTPQALQEFEHG